MIDGWSTTTTDGRPTTDRDGRRLLTAGAVLAPLLSVATSLVGYGLLPARVRVHWSLGGPYYGPEFAPTAPMLATVTVLVVGLAVGGYWLGSRLRALEADGVAFPYAVAVVGTLAVLVGTQALLVVANL